MKQNTPDKKNSISRTEKEVVFSFSKKTNGLSKQQILEKAFNFHSQGDLIKAKEYYQLYLDEGFSDPTVLCNYGVLCKQMGNTKQSILLYKKAIKNYPKDPYSYSNLGNIYREQGNLSKAKDLLLKAIKIDPNFVNAYSNLSLIFNEEGLYVKAEYYIRKAIKIDPDFANGYSNLSLISYNQAKINEAEKYARTAIKIDSELEFANLNLGTILIDKQRFEEAEYFLRKVIKINPNSSEAFSNLGIIQRDLGKLNESEKYFKKAIEINTNLSGVYFNLSILKNTSNINDWEKYLFSNSILLNAKNVDKVNIFFARSNILHLQKKYDRSINCLKIANTLKLELYPPNINKYLLKSKSLLAESQQQDLFHTYNKKNREHIFILGMPRSGSTLIESILSMNKSSYDLGERNILEDSFLEWKSLSKQDPFLNLHDLYEFNISNIIDLAPIIINKCLYNYQYVGIICSQIPNSKIIHCYRNPLDNILSIYRAHFSQGNRYASSLELCSKIYLDQDELMREYKRQYREQIYDLNYDTLVSNPSEEIKDLISWLRWNWNNHYLSPHRNNRSISTASSVQVRSPINTRSIGGWLNYKDLMSPVGDIFSRINRFKYLFD